jgi:DNA invertase Pin-like site-specific DNA recombinase
VGTGQVEYDTASGRSTRLRPGLAAALAAVDAGEADGIIVSKLDRLSRSVLDFAQLVCRAQADGWNLVVLDLGLDLDLRRAGSPRTFSAPVPSWSAF